MQCVNTKLVIILFFCTLGVPEVDNFNWYISEKCIILGDDLFQNILIIIKRYLHLIKIIHSFGRGIRDKDDFYISPIMLGG